MRGKPFSCRYCYRGLVHDEGKCTRCIEFGTPLERAERLYQHERITFCLFFSAAVLCIILLPLRYDDSRIFEKFIIASLAIMFSGISIRNAYECGKAKSVFDHELCKSIHES
jgi:hypothetical protein